METWAFVRSRTATSQSVAVDPLIPLITTALTSDSREDALASIARQHDRLTTGGYSFAIADMGTDRASLRWVVIRR